MSERVTRAGFDPDRFVTAKAAPPRATPERVLYGRDGGETDDESLAAAKSAGGRFYLRFNTAGANRECLYDPAENPDADFAAANRSRGCPAYEMRPVAREAFDRYVKYLAGRNPSNLRVAEQLCR